MELKKKLLCNSAKIFSLKFKVGKKSPYFSTVMYESHKHLHYVQSFLKAKMQLLSFSNYKKVILGILETLHPLSSQKDVFLRIKQISLCNLHFSS